MGPAVSETLPVLPLLALLCAGDLAPRRRPPSLPPAPDGDLPPAPSASSCRAGRLSPVPLGPPVPPPPAKAAAERGLPEVLKFSVAQGEDASVLVRVCQ